MLELGDELLLHVLHVTLHVTLHVRTLLGLLRLLLLVGGKGFVPLLLLLTLFKLVLVQLHVHCILRLGLAAGGSHSGGCCDGGLFQLNHLLTLTVLLTPRRTPTPPLAAMG